MDRETVKNGIECRWRMRQIKTYGCLFLLIPLFTLFIAMLSAPGAKLNPDDIAEAVGWSTGYMLILYSIIWLPFVLYNLYRYRQLINNYANYTVHTVVLDKPHTSFLYKNSVYFTVCVGGKTTVDTAPLFSDGLFSAFTLEEYAGKTVRVLYDEEKGKVYLIDKV